MTIVRLLLLVSDTQETLPISEYIEIGDRQECVIQNLIYYNQVSDLGH